jgi:dTDP-4-dehydrorhamnose reductase
MRILVTGASGQLGAYLLGELIAGPHTVTAWSGTQQGGFAGIPFQPVDVANEKQVIQALESADPELVIHAAAISSADAVCRDRDRARAINVNGTRRICEWAARHDRRLLFTSTDLVFRGTKSWYSESDEPQPLLAYGQTKAEAEAIVETVPRGLTARVGLLFGPSRCGKPGFYDRSLAKLRDGEKCHFFEDEFRTPLDYATAARILVRLGLSDARGIVHVGGRERMSRHELMRRIARTLGIPPALVQPNRLADFATPEPRPSDVSLATTHLDELLPHLARPNVETAVADFA